MNTDEPSKETAVTESNNPQPSEFERAASEEYGGLINDFWFFLRENKKWWLIPLLIVLLGLGALFVATGTAAAPFIYALF